MKRPAWLASARVLATYLILTAILYGAGEPYSRGWCRIFEHQIGFIQSEFSAANVRLTHLDGQAAFRFDGTVTVNLRARFPGISAWEQVSAWTLQAYAHNHVILVFALLAAWPAPTVRRRLRLALAGIPATVVSTSLDIPFALAGLAISEVYAAFDPGLLETDLLVQYFNFLQGGGRVLLPIAAAGLAICVAIEKPVEHKTAT